MPLVDLIAVFCSAPSLYIVPAIILTMERLLSSKTPFFLHFDINKTVIISDPVANIAQDDMLNSLLSECVWGDITITNQEKADEKTFTLSDWKLRSPIPSQTPPAPGKRVISRLHPIQIVI